MIDHSLAIALLKKEIMNVVEQVISLEKQITSLLQQKEELNSVAENLTESIKTLGRENIKPIPVEDLALKELNELTEKAET